MYYASSLTSVCVCGGRGRIRVEIISPSSQVGAVGSGRREALVAEVKEGRTATAITNRHYIPRSPSLLPAAAKHSPTPFVYSLPDERPTGDVVEGRMEDYVCVWG